MKTITSIFASAALATLAACNQSPAENAADQVREDAENTAEAMEERAEMMTNEMAEEAMENRAERLEERAENTADAMEELNTTSPAVANEAIRNEAKGR